MQPPEPSATTQPLHPGMAGPLYLEPAYSPLAIASLICSIAGYTGLPVVGWFLGIIFGHLAHRQITREPHRFKGHGVANAGLIAGYIGVGAVSLIIALVAVAVLNRP
jgi:hypothetical protein